MDKNQNYRKMEEKVFQTLEEIYEKITDLQADKENLSGLSNEELKKSKELIRTIREIGYEISQAIVNEETIRKLYSKDTKEEYGE